MKKSVIILLCILLILPVAIAPKYSYHPHDFLENNFHYNPKDSKVETTRTFEIIEDDGTRFTRTFSSYNKQAKDYNFFKTGKERKGIYRDFHDFDEPETRKKCPTDCPLGWTCTKTHQ